LSYHIAVRSHPAERGRGKLPSNAGCGCCCCCLHSAGALVGAVIGSRIAARMHPLLTVTPVQKNGEPAGVTPRLNVVNLFWRFSLLALLMAGAWREITTYGGPYHHRLASDVFFAPFTRFASSVFIFAVMALPVLFLAGAVLTAVVVAVSRYPHRSLGLRQVLKIALYSAGGMILGILSMYLMAVFGR
jgi:hypothetical protein